MHTVWGIPGLYKLLGTERVREIDAMDFDEQDAIAKGFDCQMEVARYLKRRKSGVCHKVAYIHGPGYWGWVDSERETFLAGGGMRGQSWSAVCFVPKTAHGKLSFLDAHQRAETLYEVFRRPEKWIKGDGVWVRNQRHLFWMRN